MNREFQAFNVSNLVKKEKWSDASTSNLAFIIIIVAIIAWSIIISFNALMSSLEIMFTYFLYRTYKNNTNETEHLLSSIVDNYAIKNPATNGRFILDQDNKLIYYYDPENDTLYHFPAEVIDNIFVDSSERTWTMHIQLKIKGDNKIPLQNFNEKLNYSKLKSSLIELDERLKISRRLI